ncbi:uncharacterized protein PAC_05070 [Phialocephala subalpina]|uniref:Aminoglycoside phosphotransferase domain-containing protein n=1 Tax=Phialocephala subalpina TaxID=576137 RepID=A0A1L7WQY3_9HELO|nr:uncharacterized protein PAC_05070 [Phialocephala subalpina]
MAAHIPTSPAPGLDIDAKEAPFKEQPTATATTLETPQKADISSSADNSASCESSINTSEAAVVVTPVQSIEGATSPARSDASTLHPNFPLSSPAQSNNGRMSPAKSGASDAHSQPHSGGNRSSAASSDGKDYETFGKDQDSYEDFKPKLIKLCHDIGYGEPAEIERMEGGSFNKIIGLRFTSPGERKCIIRMPLFVYDERQPHEISDQVSVLLYLSRCNFMKVPQVLAYDSTSDNAIGTQYILQSRLPGSCMQDVFYKLPRHEKLHLTGLVAGVAAKMSSMQLPQPGRLIGTRTLPQFAHTPPESLANIEVTGYRECPIQDPPALEEKPLLPFLVDLLEFRKEQEHESVQRMYSKLQEIAREMDKAGLMRVYDNQNVLWHWDFAARNILIQQEDIAGPPKGCHHSFHFSVEENSGSSHKHTVNVKLEDPSSTNCKHKVSFVIEDNNGREYRHQLDIVDKKTPEQDIPKQWAISGVLDWDDVLSVPLVIARKPHAWLWLDEEERHEDWAGNQDDPPHRDLTQDELLIKGHYDQIMARSCPNFMEDAYGRGPWLRTLASFGRDGFGDSQDWKRYEKFIAKWAEYYRGMGFKTEEELDDTKSDGGESDEAEFGEGKSVGAETDGEKCDGEAESNGGSVDKPKGEEN